MVNGSNAMLHATNSSEETGGLETVDAISVSEVTERSVPFCSLVICETC